MSPPRARAADAPPHEFSAGRARVHLETIAKRPHPIGSVGAREVEQYIVRTLTDLGLRVESQELPSCATLAEIKRCAYVRNVLATFPGRDSSAAILLSAHYDTVPNAPGAADDGAAVASLLETARALTVTGPRAHDVMFAFVDGEEELLLGAAALVRSPPFARVRLAANFEARGSRGASALFAVSSDSAPIVEQLAKVVDHPVTNSFFSTVASLLPNGTDAEAYDRAGVKILSFAFVQGVERYHQGTDTPAHLDLDSLEHHGRYALALANHFADADLPSLVARGGDDAFFDIGGWFVIRYPFWAARALAFATCVLLGWTCWLQLRDRRATVRAIVACGALFTLFLGAIALLTTAVVRLVTIDWAFWSPFVHGGALATGTGCLAIAALVALLAFQCRRWGEGAPALGPLVVCGVLTAATGVVAPGASHVLAWPTAAATAIVLLERRPSLRVEIVKSLLLVPAAVLQAQVLYTLVAVVGGGAMAVPMIAAGIWLGVVAPAIVPLARHARFFTRAFSVAGAAALIVTSFVGRAGSPPATGNAITYAVDAQEKTAFWVSADRDEDSWKRQFLGTSPNRGRMTSFSSLSPLFFRAAPAMDLPAPTVAVESDQMTHATRELVLRVRSPRSARGIVVWETTGARVPRWSFEGAVPFPIVRVSEELDTKGYRLLTGWGYDGAWTVHLFAVPADGARLHLVTNETRPLEFRVMDVSDELALVPPAFRARGAEWTAGYPGDQTWVSGEPLRVAARGSSASAP